MRGERTGDGAGLPATHIVEPFLGGLLRVLGDVRVVDGRFEAAGNAVRVLFCGQVKCIVSCWTKIEQWKVEMRTGRHICWIG